ncbi:tetratricopeptide repeat-containing sulfotransferase family protein [Hyphococcus sp.]|uniref:tetratricopeptide repeat-containing sulfotransferase family protein n=1 Tax=Hyphococcus sp. TaxID=2038636 RepID=UPI003CCBE808
MSGKNGSNLKSLDASAAQARTAMQTGAFAEALRIALAVLDEAPDNLAMLKIASIAATELRDWGNAIQAGEQWRANDPANSQAIHILANAYFENGDPIRSRDTFHALVEANPRSADHLNIYSRLCLAAFDYEGAAQALEKAQRLAPASAENRYALGRLKLFLGSLDEAEALSAEAMRLDPNFSMAYAQYTKLRNGDVADDIKMRMERLGARGELPPEHRASLFFALGEINHSRRNYRAAIRSFDQANEISSGLLRAQGLAYSPARYESQRALEDKIFSAPPEKYTFAKGPARPVFVVGMPRSGTTLVESVLAAHPQVYGAGELNTLPAVYSNVLAWTEQAGGKTLADAPHEKRQAWRDQYFAGYPDFGGALCVVDKQPLNFRAPGLIRSLFPEAVIIHIRRNPVDTGFSIYRNDFGKAWPFAVDLESIAHFYGEYARVSAHWEKILGSGFPLFQYEDLIADFETEARRIVALCGLNWRAECLEFHKYRRPIATFSSAQVRQPLRKSAQHAEDKYGDLLGPLIQGLRRARVDLETGALKP